LSLKNKKINETLPENTFQFVIPDNIDVLDNTQ